MFLESHLQPSMREKWEALENLWEEEIHVKKPQRTKFRDHPTRFHWVSKTAKRKGRRAFPSERLFREAN